MPAPVLKAHLKGKTFDSAFVVVVTGHLLDLFLLVRTGNKAEVTAFAFNQNSEQFAAASLDKTVAIYSLDKKNLRCLRFDQKYEIYDLDWSCKNLLASVGKDKICNVFEPIMHKGYSEMIVAHQQTIRSVHFSNSGNR